MSVDPLERARELLRKAGSETATAAAPTPATSPTATAQAGAVDLKEMSSLENHPGVVAAVRQREWLQAGLQALGAPNPYFAPHEGVNGATVEIDGESMINFSGYNYLGLAGDARVQSAAKAAIESYGTSCSASRVVSGQIPMHAQLEQRIASAYGTDDAVLAGSGFLTNAAVIGFVLGEGDLAVCDALVHNSIVSGTRWAGCKRVNFRHNDPEALETLLARTRSHFQRAMVIVEGVYSMDGDIVALPELLEVARRYDCLVMVDEAHSFGVLGEQGHGIHELYDMPADAVDIWMGTLSKSLASYGGFLAVSENVGEALRMTAAGLNMFAAGSPPAQVAAAIAAFDIMHEEPWRLQRLLDNGRLFARLAREAGLNIGDSADTPIVPAIYGDTRRTLINAMSLHRAGINANPIAYPAVSEQDARIRFFITSEHTEQQIEYTVEVLKGVATES